MTTYPTGRGFFIWQNERCAGGDPARLADMAAAAGIQWVSFKIANGVAPRNGDISRHVQALANVGVASWGWAYCYGWSPEVEARIALDRCQGFGLAGYMLNAEHEYKRVGAADFARRMMAVFAMSAPHMPVGLCSYRFPTLHRTLPWQEFLDGCTFHNPQVYWLEDNRPAAPADQLARSLRELRALRDLPIVPLGVASPNDAATWYPTVAQLDNFDAAAQASDLGGYGWWSWEHAERRAEVWQAIARHGPPPTPPPGDSAADVTAIRAAAGRILGRVT